MQKLEILEGQKFNSWTVLYEAEPQLWGTKKIRVFHCRCDCGNESVVRLNGLTRGTSKQCKDCSYRQQSHQDEDFIGKRFSMLLVVKRGEKPDNVSKQGTWWWCRCDCGREKSVSSSHLLSSYTVKSCGCASRLTGNKATQWQGYGEISKTVLLNIRRNATKRNLSFDLSIEELWDLFLSQNRKCALTGMSLCFPISQRSMSSGTASLDRIDSSKGYELDNVQWVHKDINLMKGTLSDTDFINYCRAVIDYANII